MLPPTRTRRIRFGVFEVDLRSGELYKRGLKVKLQDQPLQLLALLLEHPGEVVTREELREKLWPANTFVDFDVGLNAAIKRLRDALSDSAESPRFVETLPRKGYRFIAPIENGGGEGARTAPPHSAAGVEESPAASPAQLSVAVASMPSGARRRFWTLSLSVVGFACISALVFGLNLGRLRDRLVGKAAGPRIRSVAVLPFDNLTGDPSQDYFVEGMTDALTTELVQIKALRVISRTSVTQYKGVKTKLLPQIAKELNVDAVVEGTVRRAGDQVWITPQLIEATTDRHLWAKPYERNLREVPALQSQVAQDIVREMRIELTAGEQTRLAGPRPPVNLEAYEAYLLGRFFWTKRDAQSLRRSIEYYKQAIAKDPNYAAAYAGLAESYETLAFGLAALEAVMPTEEAAAKARAAALKALELNDNLAEAHTVLGQIWANEHDLVGAERELHRAIELNPSYANAYHSLARLLTGAGRNEEALGVIQRAHEMDPLSPNILHIQGVILTRLQRYDEAMQAFQKALALAPNQINVHITLANHYEVRGMYPQALVEYQKIAELMNRNPKSMLMIAYMYAMMGRKPEAEKTLRELKERATQDKTAFWFALVTNALGRRDEALMWLERARVEDALQGVEIDNFRFGPLRSDPRYQSWLRRVGLPTNENKK